MTKKMSITTNRLMQIITEEVRRDTLMEKVVSVSKVLKAAPLNTSVNISKTKTIKFGTLMEHVNRKIITEAEAFHLWERSVSYQMDQLITEGVVDSLKDAYETVKGGALKLKDKISAAAASAMEKVNDFLLKISIQAMNLAQSSVAGIVQAARMLSGAVQRFKDNHPILYKIIMVLVIMLIIFGIMSLFSGEAHAAVRSKGGRQMSQKHYEALRGALSEHGDKSDIGKMMDAGNAIKILDKAYQSKEVIPIEKLGAMNRAGHEMITNLVGEARGGDRQAFSLLQKWSSIGSRLTVR